MTNASWCLWLSETSSGDTPRVGGKNASLGEMVHHLGELGIRVPDGFATTADAYWNFIDANGLRDAIGRLVGRLDDGAPVEEIGPEIRALFEGATFPDAVAASILDHYDELSKRAGRSDLDVAVRSSATAEDLPEASFAGQQETFLNVRGHEQLLDACRRCYASLFTDRAIAYRGEQGFDHLEVALSVGVQRMVRSDLGGAGVMFTIDTETGFPDAVLISASWGLGEAVVSGIVDPDEYVVFKPLLSEEGARPIISKERGRKECKVVYRGDGGSSTVTVDTERDDRESFVLSDDDILRLGHHAAAIERHYGRPMDIEWARDGETGELFIVQARPETVVAGRSRGNLRTYSLCERGALLAEGEAIGQAIASGPAVVLTSAAEVDRFPAGAVLVAAITDPDWVPIMRRASAIVTDHGGRTSHAAIVSRELGVPAVIGTGNATQVIADGTEVTISCAEGDRGFVYGGRLAFDEKDLDVEHVPSTRTRVMLNVANPAAALRWWRLPTDGIGLARMEFIVGQHVQVHPMALVHPERLDSSTRSAIAELTAGYDDPTDYFVDNLAWGIARIAASQHPAPVILRLSDFKTNEYAELVGGRPFEPEEENPMIGWRGASRYDHPGYREGFALECRAIRKVRDEIGLRNLVVMVPFCRTPEEGDAVLAALAEHGLARGDGLEIYVMAEIPSNVLLAEEYAERFDGFSIGSNDLTQLVLGIDRDSDILRSRFDENHPAVRKAITMLIDEAHGSGTKVGLCGQAPSDDPAFAEFLVRAGIDSISVTPDSFVAVKEHVARAEKEIDRQ